MRPKLVGLMKTLGGLVPSRIWCTMLGHDLLPLNEKERKALQCVRCPYQSPGWETGGGSVWVRESDAPGAKLIKRPLTKN